MDGQNFTNGFDDNENTNTTPETEPTPENVTTSASESTVETVNVNTGNYQDNNSSFGSYNNQGNTINAGSYNYQDNASNSSSYNYQGNTINAGSYNYQDNTANAGSYNYQDNTAQYYTTPVYTDNSNQQGESASGFAIGSLVLGIVSILFCCCWGGGIVFAIPGIIMGISANKKNKTGVGTAGIICSIVGAVLNGLMLLYFAFILIVSFASGM